MKVAELIAALQQLPPEAEVYVDEPPDDYNVQGSERPPIVALERPLITLGDGVSLYPEGRVKL